MRVLVVEDDPSTAVSVAATIRRCGYDVTITTDAAAAWKQLNAVRTPIVVTDWQMPGEDGLSLCRRIRSASFPFYTYVIFLTARGARRHMVEVLSSGADDFIAKPFDPEELRVRLLVAERIIKLESRLREANEDLQVKNERLHETSRTDSLMQIGNRAAFNEIIERVHRRAAGDGSRYGLVMCDLDHFKHYNDTFGHQVGDQILARVGCSVKLAIRATDWAFRYGGEEIALVLDGHDLDSAQRVAERVRRQIETLKFQSGDRQAIPRATISCGVASYPENGSRGDVWQTVVRRADEALYAAKRAGRNRTVANRSGELEPADRSLMKVVADDPAAAVEPFHSAVR